jgi:hypothetical protein
MYRGFRTRWPKAFATAAGLALALAATGTTAAPAALAASAPALTPLGAGGASVPAPPMTTETYGDPLPSGCLHFDTDASLQEVVDYYRRAMKKLKWKEPVEPFKRDDIVGLEFVKGPTEVDVFVTGFEGKTQVQIADVGAVSQAMRANEPPDSDAKLKAAPGDTHKPPLPAKAEKLVEGGADKGLDFVSKASMKALIDYYRSTLRAKGWKQYSAPLDHCPLDVLHFAKGEERLAITIAGDIASKDNVAVNVLSQDAKAK